MPEMVKKFLTYFRNVISEGLIFEIQNLYENSFPKLTEQYFEKRPWPDEEEVAKIVDNDPVSMLSFISFVLFSVNQQWAPTIQWTNYKPQKRFYHNPQKDHLNQECAT